MPSAMPEHHRGGREQPRVVDGAGDGDAGAEVGEGRRQVRVGGGHRQHRREHARDNEGALDRTEPVLALTRPRQVHAGQRRDDAGSQHDEGEHEPGCPERGPAEDDRGDQHDGVRLEQVGGHPGAVADVVAHVVGDRRGVARVVLGDVLLDLADEVGADVGGLGEDAAADPHEHGEQRGAEAEALQHDGSVAAEDEDDDGGARGVPTRRWPCRRHRRYGTRCASRRHDRWSGRRLRHVRWRAPPATCRGSRSGRRRTRRRRRPPIWRPSARAPTSDPRAPAAAAARRRPWRRRRRAYGTGAPGTPPLPLGWRAR